MSIHQSKGLEFPVVVVPDLDRLQRGPGGKVAFTPRLGPLLKDPGVEAAGGYDLFWLSESQQEEAELARLLYVATTRAADYLILSSGLAELGKAKGPWMELLGRRFNLLSGQPRDASAGPVRVKVTTSPPPLTTKPAETPRRRSIEQLVEKAAALAAEGRGRLPRWLDPVPPDRQGRRQYSFSRLTGQMHASHTPASAAAADGEEAAEPLLDPRGLGTLVHAVLADLDLARPEQVAALVHRHAPRHLSELGSAAAELDEPIALVERLLASPRGAALAAATERYTGTGISLGLAAGQQRRRRPAFAGFHRRVSIATRPAAGICSTSRPTASRRQSLPRPRPTYEMQMLVYGLAVQQILGRPPEELTLCFLRPGVEHRFAWDAAARKRAVEMVEEALRKARE